MHRSAFVSFPSFIFSFRFFRAVSLLLLSCLFVSSVFFCSLLFASRLSASRLFSFVSLFASNVSSSLFLLLRGFLVLLYALHPPTSTSHPPHVPCSPQREAAAQGFGATTASGAAKLAADDATPAEDSADPRAGVAACWRRCLQDAGSAIYSDGQRIQPYLLKAQALQEFER